ncbi:hscB [Mytilus coruscus]|uniref:HscB n=1 Tax=Mytilus coruscus TaxID=42192 RepID=A0A6J8DMT2_MYTCO|nr:hscB [Mytilus coruscus]
MSLDDNFDVDTTLLSQKYKELQKLLHPDKHTLKSEEEKRLFEEQSSLVNKAYSTLIKPLNRALYMLEQAGHPIEEQNSDVDQDFLMEIMEINEDIADADSLESLKPIEIVNKKRLEDNISKVSKAFHEGDITAAKQLIIKLKYFTNIDDKIKDIYRGQF